MCILFGVSYERIALRQSVFWMFTSGWLSHNNFASSQFLRSFPDFRIFLQISLCLKTFLKACVLSKLLVSCLWRCGESVNPPKLNIQEVQGALSSRPKGYPGLLVLPIFHDFFTFVNHTHAFPMLYLPFKKDITVKD